MTREEELLSAVEMLVNRACPGEGECPCEDRKERYVHEFAWRVLSKTK